MIPFLPLVLAFAQVVTPADQAKPLLESPRLRDKAWGAWLAGAAQDAELQPALLGQLRQSQALRFAPYGSEEYALIGTLFDALIRIGGPVPLDAILPFETSWRGEILILLSRGAVDSAAESALLDLRGRQISDPEWIAVNDLLFAASSKAFFQKTLEEIRITHRFLVVDGGGGVLGCGGGATFRCGSGLERIPPGFPPHARYILRTAAEPGDVLLVAQPIPVYYREGDSGCRNLGSAQDRQDLLVRYFAAITGGSAEDARKIFHADDSVRSAEEIETKLAAQSASIQAVIADAQKRGLVEASGMRFAIEITLEDLRGDRTAPLPAIPPHEAAIPQR
jgi:hypothetical protein